MIPYGAIEEWFGAIYQGVDYSWRFEVSTFGRLRNAKTKHIYSFGYGDGGYLQACVSINGKRLNVHVHRCVAETFLPNECGYEIVNHMDGCKQHNDVWNLEWCTRKENYFHAVDQFEKGTFVRGKSISKSAGCKAYPLLYRDDAKSRRVFYNKQW